MGRTRRNSQALGPSVDPKAFGAFDLAATRKDRQQEPGNKQQGAKLQVEAGS